MAKGPPKKYKTEAERKAALKIAQQKYQKSKKYKEAQKKYAQSTKGKVAKKKYFSSEKGKTLLKKNSEKYFNSEKGKEYRKKYQKSEEFKKAQKKYAQSTKGKVAQKKYFSSEKGIEYMKKYRKEYYKTEKGKKIRKASNAKWHKIYEKDPVLKARQLESIKNYYKTEKGKLSAAAIRSRRRKGLRIAEPVWNKRKLVKQIFKMRNDLSSKTGNTYDVDHIIPVKGKTSEGGNVSGLHVWYNLIPIKRLSNMKKHNRVPPQKQLDKLPGPDQWISYLKNKLNL